MDIAWENPQIIRMMSNENLLAPSENVMDAIVEAARLGNLYPGSGPELRKKLGEAAGLTAEHVVLGNGSTDVINFVIHTFVAPGEDVVISVPTSPCMRPACAWRAAMSFRCRCSPISTGIWMRS